MLGINKNNYQYLKQKMIKEETDFFKDKEFKKENMRSNAIFVCS